MDQALSAIPFAFPGVPGVHCLFTTRLGGVSEGVWAEANISYDVGDDPGHVAANRRKLAGLSGIKAWKLLRQVHGDHMALDPAHEAIEVHETEEGDGLATSRPGLALGIKTADCQPVLLAHASSRFVAGLHVGWRGNVMGFIQSGVARFGEHYQVRPEDILAVRGPSLGPASAEFTRFEEELGEGFGEYFDPATRTVDLWRLTRDQLIAAGLKAGNIFSVDRDTMADESFFSYRRSRTTGRQASLIWIEG